MGAHVVPLVCPLSSYTTNNTHPLLLLLLLLAPKGSGSPLLLLLMISTGIPSGLRYAVLYDFILNLPKFQEIHWVCDLAAVHPLSFFSCSRGCKATFLYQKACFQLMMRGSGGLLPSEVTPGVSKEEMEDLMR